MKNDDARGTIIEIENRAWKNPFSPETIAKIPTEKQRMENEECALKK